MKFIKIFFGICFTLMGLISILPGDAMDASTRNVGIILLIIGILLLRSALKKKKNAQNPTSPSSQNSIFEFLKNSKYKKELQELQAKYDELSSSMTPEMRDAHALQQLVESLESKKTVTENEIFKQNITLQNLENQISSKKKELICMNEEVLVQEFGLYTPQYDFASALDYKEELAKIRQIQKDLIKEKKAVLGNTEWTVNNSKAKGKKMVSDTQKLLLRAFNTECDDLIDRVKYNNFDATLDRIYKSAETITKLGSVMNITITLQYLDAKV